MNCREFRSLVRAAGGDRLDPAATAHRARCAACDREARAATLLRLGSSLITERPRDGFEDRLRARIAAEPASPPVVTWADEIGRLARPALGLASVALAAALAWGGWTFYRPSSDDDLAVLTGGDPLVDAVLSAGLEEIGTADSAEEPAPGDGE